MDMQTVLTSYFISALICAAVMAVLWRQNHKHFDGLVFWLADYVLQFIALPLVLLQGKLPDFVSMTIGNGLGITGALLLYIGLERFVGKRSRQFHNYVILAAFLVVHTWFIFGDPSLTARKVNVSAALILIAAQSAWLMFRRVDAELRSITRGTGLVFIASIILNIARIYVVLVMPSDEDFLGSNAYDTILLMSYQMLMIGLTFSLFAMVNRRLSINLRDDIENRKQVESKLRESEGKFYKAFHSSPDLAAITRMSDGSFVEISESFSHVTGYSREEALNSSVTTLNIWTNLQDRESFIQRLKAEGVVRAAEYKYRTKSGEIRTGLLSAEIIQLGNEPHIVSVIHDITERKQVEKALRESRETLALFINQSPIYAYIKEVAPTQSRVIYASENFIDMIGIPGSEMVGKTMEELFPAEFAAKITADDWAVASGKGILNQEEELNGRQYITIKFPLLRTGMVNLLAGYTIDITERKQAEAALRESEKRFRQLITSAPDVVFLVDQQGKIMFANMEATNLLGYAPDEFIGMDVENLIPQKSREGHIANRANYMSTARPRLIGSRMNLLAVHKDGSEIPVDIKLSPVQMETETYIIAFLRDITERKQAEEKLLKAKEDAEESETRFRKSLEFSPTPMAVADHTGKMIFLNQSFIATYGYTLQDTPSIDQWMLKAYPDPEYRNSYLQQWGQDTEYAVKNNTTTPLREYQVTCKSGEVKTVAILAFFEKDLIIGHFLDVSDRVRAEGELRTSNETLKTQFNEISMLKDALQKQAIHDPLTNLHNRRYLNEMLEHEVARATRENYPIGIMLIDIDRFKGFNDTYGHSAGDEMLKSLSHLLVESIREGDVACRYGGEEFLVVMIGAHEIDVKRRAEEICQNFSRLQIRFGEQELSATVSIGVAFYPKHGTEIQSVIDAADAAMYQAKQAGRNRVQVWQAGE